MQKISSARETYIFHITFICLESINREKKIYMTKIYIKYHKYFALWLLGYMRSCFCTEIYLISKQLQTSTWSNCFELHACTALTLSCLFFPFMLVTSKIAKTSPSLRFSHMQSSTFYVYFSVTQIFWNL